jgi:hypothetical protein
MRATIVSIALLLVAAPAIAADPAIVAPPPAPPSPPAVTYEVWGFKLTGGQWVRQPNYSFTTTDLKQAADYKAQINSFAGWTVTTNLPDASYVHTVYDDPMVSSLRPTQTPAAPMYSVWAYKFADGKWVKDDKQSWTTPDPAAGLQYAANLSAVAGWTATTNCPAVVPQAQRYVNGGTVQGAENYAMHINIGGFSFAIPYSAIHNAGSGSDSGGSDDSDSSFYDNFSSSSDTSLQDSLATQDMINNEQMNTDEQESLNDQNFFNTENMLNTQQENIDATGSP